MGFRDEEKTGRNNDSYGKSEGGYERGGRDKDKRKRRKAPPKEVVCRFSEEELNVGLDYKAIGFISKFRSSQGKILSRKRTGLNKQYQKKLSIAVKRARFIGLLGYTEV